MAKTTIPITPESESFYTLPRYLGGVLDVKVCYTINWKEEGLAKWSFSSTKSSTTGVNTFLQKINQKLSTKLSGPRLFGFGIKPLYDIRDSQLIVNITETNKRKRPLEDMAFT
ncbi:16436_t:CDS:2 [Funneliformis mosseae]|uniref:16436_t:CDS:1 n=1 Tax=Funneliformis mosseae TaxID=27381 RepID=A0A9N9F8X3_FUNMO|nr:16436_t:CDS:2 [Funneliformis mosseae]